MYTLEFYDKIRDIEWDCTYKYAKVIQGATFIEDY